MKIIRGGLKNRMLKVPQNIRPASFRIKKAIFDLINQEIIGKKVLDLFAGSGSLGIEALSGGAMSVTFVDLRRACIKTIMTNIISLKLSSRSEVFLKDSFKTIKDFYNRGRSFDVIFLDPPYYKMMAKKALQTISEYDILAPSGYIVTLCYQNEGMQLKYGHFELILTKNYGQSMVLIYRKKEVV